ncbi:MAG: glycosyltransferase family 87 protein [Pseudomonadota bacterium]
MRERLLVAALLLLHLALIVVPSVREVALRPAGGDLASSWCAVRTALDGQDPYDLAALQAPVQAAGHSSKGVEAFLYPPPALLWFLWSAVVSLPLARWLWFGANLGLLAGAVFLLRRWIGARLSTVLMAAALFTPLIDNARMGQVNLLVLLLVLLALQGADERRGLGGVAVAAGFLTKLSPAILVPWLLVRRRWRALLGFAAGAVVLSLLAAPLTGPGASWRFWSEVLPGFSRGHYGQNAYDIVAFRGHSLLRLAVLLIQGQGEVTEPGLAARIAANMVALGLLGGALWVARPVRSAREPGIAAALCVVMIVSAPFTWEHHLVLALLPVAVALHGARTGLLGRRWRAMAVIAALMLMIPASWWEKPAWLFPELFTPCTSAKTLALLALWAVGLRYATALEPRGAEDRPPAPL